MDEEPSIQRRLAAILAADIAGYSRLMHADEAATVRDLKAHQSVILPLVGRHGGRIIDVAGDGIMAEFPSVIGATECAVEIQTVMAERNAGVSENRRMRFRIGINLGDVIHDDSRIYGDGINIAARLEALAEPGGVLVSHTVYDQVRGKLPFTFDDVGERQVKNIEQPVRMYRLHIPGASAEAVAPLHRRPATTDRRRWIAWGLAAFLVLVGAAGAWWMGSRWFHSPQADSPGAPRLSIVVLPFRNLSGDPSEDYFADGITEDLTSDLSRIAGSFVISRNTAFTFKDKAVDARQVGRELGVRYVLEGSVRRMGGTVRVNAQLIDAGTGAHLWAEQMDVDHEHAGEPPGQSRHREPARTDAQCRARQCRGPPGAARQPGCGGPHHAWLVRLEWRADEQGRRAEIRHVVRGSASNRSRRTVRPESGSPRPSCSSTAIVGIPSRPRCWPVPTKQPRGPFRPCRTTLTLIP